MEIFTPENSYIMYAGTKNEKKVWLQKLRTTIAMALHGPEATEKDQIGNYYQLFNVFILSTCSVTSDTARYFAQIMLDPWNKYFTWLNQILGYNKPYFFQVMYVCDNEFETTRNKI